MREVSFSQLDCARRCRFKWGLRYLLKLRKSEPSKALDLGRLMHQALHRYYTLIYPQDRPFGTAEQSAFWNMLLAGQEEATELADMECAVKLLDAYHVHYSEIDHAEGQIVQDVEFGFKVSVPTPSGTRSNYALVGFVDLITRDLNGMWWIWDHKTGKSFPSRPSLTMDSQLSMYSWVLHRWGFPSNGVTLNLLKTTKEPQFARLRMLKSSDEIRHWGDVLYHDCRTLPSKGERWQELQRNPNINCSWDCEYLDLCRLDMEGERDAFRDLASMEYNVGSSSRPQQRLHLKAPKGWGEEKSESDAG